MRTLITVLLLGLASISQAQMPSKVSAKDNPDMYWNRGFGCSQSAESYNVSLRVANVDALAAKIDVMMTDAGAPSQMGQNNNYGGSQRGRHLSYSLPSKTAEKFAKKVMDMGELLNYSLNRQNGGDTVKQLDERIAVLESEAASDALAKLPAASFFLKSKLTQMKQNREMCSAGANRSTISVNLQSKTDAR